MRDETVTAKEVEKKRNPSAQLRAAFGSRMPAGWADEQTITHTHSNAQTIAKTITQTITNT